MRLTGILLLVAVIHVSAGTTTAQTVTYSAHATPLSRVLAVIQQQTGFNVFYDEADLKESSPVTVDLYDTPLHEALERVLAGQPLQFNIEGNTVFVTRKEPVKFLPAGPPPPMDVHGRITDSTGAPLAGVNVMIKGKNKGTITNLDGFFDLKGISSDAILIFSNVGYRTKEMRLDGRQDIQIVLQVDVVSMKDIVINKGYYKTTDRLNTGSVTKVTSEDLQKQPVTDPIIALQGRVPGLYIQQTSGITGSNPIVRLRGQNSINSSNVPLYIVDGVPFSSQTLTSPNIGGGAVGYNSEGQGLSPFNMLDMSNIESIEVLKDAEATAIYGSRGANGVILISTKSGKAGKTRLNLNLSEGISQVSSKMDLMNTQQYLSMRRQALKNDGKLPDVSDFDVNGTWDTTRYTDWQKALIGGNAQYTFLSGSLSGGNNNTTFILDGSYKREGVVYPGDYSDEKGGAHFNVTHSSTNQKLHISFTGMYQANSSIVPKADYTGSVNMAPDAPALYNSDGTLNWGIDPVQGPTWNNPLGSTLIKAKATSANMIGNLSAGYELFRGLELKSTIGYKRSEMNQTIRQPAAAFYGPPNPYNRMNSIATTNTSNMEFNPMITYRGWISKGKLDVFAGMTQGEEKYNSIGYWALGFTSDALIGNPSFASYYSLRGSYIESLHRYTSLYGRLSYNWDDRYLFNFTVRRDGSSRFGPDREFGTFGSLSAAWIFTKSKWVTQHLPLLNFGKVRASYGTAGNDGIGDYKYLSTYSAYYNPYYQGVSTLYPTGLANPYYSWEVTKKIDIGIDLSFFKDRISLTADYYRNRNGNQLVGQSLPWSTGFNLVTANSPALVQNAGVELVLTTANVKGKYFNWTTTFNLSVPKNKLLAYPNLAATFNAYAFTIGKPVYEYATYHYTGVNPQTGLYTFQDVNKDGVLTDADLQFITGAWQHYFGGFTNTFSYKEWQMDIFFQYVNQTGKNYLSTAGSPGFFNINQLNLVANAWQAPGDKADIQRYSSTGGLTNNTYSRYISSDAVFTDASFIRLKTLQIAYRLPSALQQKMHIQNLSLYLRGENLLTLTKYQGYDPDTQNATALPPLRKVTAGIEIVL